MARNLIYFDPGNEPDFRALIAGIVEAMPLPSDVQFLADEWDVAAALGDDHAALLAYGPSCVARASIGRIRRFEIDRMADWPEPDDGVVTVARPRRPAVLLIREHIPESMGASMTRQAATILAVDYVFDLSVEAAHGKLRAILGGG